MTTNYDEHDERFDDTFFVIEATGYEQLCIWRDFHEEMGITWEQQNPGLLVTVGHINKMPICISMSWNKIRGKRVLFFEATSQVVDHEVVEKWIERNIIKDHRYDGRMPRSDAMNAHHLMSALDFHQNVVVRFGEKFHVYDSIQTAAEGLDSLGFTRVQNPAGPDRYGVERKFMSKENEPVMVGSLYYAPNGGGDASVIESPVPFHSVKYLNEKLAQLGQS